MRICKDCLETLPDDDFQHHRGICRACYRYKENLKRRLKRLGVMPMSTIPKDPKKPRVYRFENVNMPNGVEICPESEVACLLRNWSKL